MKVRLMGGVRVGKKERIMFSVVSGSFGKDNSSKRRGQAQRQRRAIKPGVEDLKALS